MGFGSSSGNQTRREFFYFVLSMFSLLLAMLLSQTGVMGRLMGSSLFLFSGVEDEAWRGWECC
jgi:uncharacterized membrane protein YhaH (DUF805 family)